MRIHCFSLVVLVLLITAPGAATADSVIDMCTDYGDTDKVCECAASALRDVVGDDAYGKYEAVGAIYRENLAAGQDMGDAWSAALVSAGVALSDTNPVGSAHRKAMKACTG